MTIGESALAGFNVGAGSRSTSGIGGFIREKLEMAKAKNLGAFKSGLKVDEAIATEGATTKRAFQTTESGETIPITFGDGEVDFAKGDKIFSPSEGLTGSEKAFDELKEQKIRERLAEEEGGENVIQAGGGANLKDATGSGIAGQQVALRQQAMEFLKQQGAPVTEANIAAVIARQGQ